MVQRNSNRINVKKLEGLFEDYISGKTSIEFQDELIENQMDKQDILDFMKNSGLRIRKERNMYEELKMRYDNLSEELQNLKYKTYWH